MRKSALFLFALLSVATAPSHALSVVATVKPLQLIANALLLDADQSEALLPNGASPHDYQLRPSDLRRLNSADLVVWVGPSLEGFMRKPLAALPDSVSLLQLDNGSAATEPASPADHHHDHHQGHGHDHQDGNPHLWLDPLMAIRIAKEIGERLRQLDPANAGHYQHNEARFIAAVQETEQGLREQLRPLSGRGYFVFHDAYEPFESHFGLNHLGAFTLSPERAPGARHLQSIRTQLERQQAVCVFAEPQFRSSLVDAVTEGLEVNQGVLDPLGATANDYPALLQQLADAFTRCLTPK